MRIAFCNSEYCDICGGNPQRCGLLHNGIAACVAVILMAAGAEERIWQRRGFPCKIHDANFFLMHTLFAAPTRAVLLKLGIGSSVIHVVLGLGISFV